MKLEFSWLLRSFSTLLFQRFEKKTYDIIFYYPTHFNRLSGARNPFFEPLIALCKHHNITYLLIEEPDLQVRYARNSNAMPFDAALLAILLLRKLLPLSLFPSFEEREYKIAKALKFLFFRRLRFKNYIVLSQSMIAFFRGLNSKANLYDYQHGIIHSKKEGYIANGAIEAPIKRNHSKLLVYSDIFKEILYNTTHDDYVKENVYVLGRELTRTQYEVCNKKAILFTSQLCTDPMELNQRYVNEAVALFKAIDTTMQTHKLHLLFKHHPRFQHDVDISKFFKFSWFTLYEGDLDSALEKSALHITFQSTTLFEASSKGIVTLLLDNSCFDPHLYHDEYLYPLAAMSALQINEKISLLVTNKARCQEQSDAVFQWFNTINMPINEELFLTLFKGES